MSTSKPQKHLLNVSLTDPSPYAMIRVFNGFNQPVGKPLFGTYSKLLRPGLYRIEAELNGLIAKDSPIIALEEDKHFVLETPKQYSSIPMMGFGSSYDYYTRWAERWSKEITYEILPNELNREVGDLFIFFRFANRMKAEESGWSEQLGTRFSIWTKVDKHFEFLTGLWGDTVQHDSGFGSVAFHSKPAVGTYFLAYRNQQDTYTLWPLYLTKGWQTQLFMTFDVNGPLFDSLRILLGRPEKGFQPDRIDNRHLDNAILWLQNGIYNLPEELIRDMDREHWDNPMLYLVVAHMLLVQSKPNTYYIRRFILHVERLLDDKDLPGIKSLRFLLAYKTNKPLPNLSIDEPPLFQPLLDSIIKSSASRQDLIKTDSLTDLISTQLSTKSPWTSFDVPANAIDGQADAWLNLNMFTDQIQQLMSTLHQHQYGSYPITKITVNDQSKLVKEKTSKRRSSQSDLSLDTLAQSVQLSPNTVRRVVNMADEVLENNPEIKQSLTKWLDYGVSGKQTQRTLERCVSDLKKIVS